MDTQVVLRNIIAPVATLLLAGNASANVIIYNGLEGGSGDVENVLYNSFSGQQGTTVQGSLNQSGDLVNFTSTDVLITPPGGQARITALDGSLTDLSIELADPTLGFGKIQFNIDAAANGSATLSFWDQFGGLFSGNYSLNKKGQNFFTAIAYDDQVIVRAKIDSSVALTAISDVQQIRLGTVPRTDGPPPTVAEPGTLSLVTLGLAMMAFAIRRRAGALAR